MKNFRRTDILFFGTMLVLIIYVLIGLILSFFHVNIFPASGIISYCWILFLAIIILPVRLFPKTKFAKWWNQYPFNK